MQKKPAELVELPQFPGLKLPSIEGRFFCSRRDPAREAVAWFKAQQFLLSDIETVVILGLGAGLHLAAFPENIKVHVLELRSELIDFWRQANPDSLAIVHQNIENLPETLILEFRPAWSGMEEAYQAFSRTLRQAARSALQEAAEKKDLWILSEALQNANDIPENIELTIKDIAQAIPMENQSEEARLWRALRELVQ